MPGLAAADNVVVRESSISQWLHGDPTAALREPNSVVITESSAQKYFGRTDVLGETLVLEDNQPVEVTGVITDLPDNTHLRFSMLVSMQYAAATVGDEFMRQWGLNCLPHVRIIERTRQPGGRAKAGRRVLERHLGAGASKVTSFTLLAVTDIHLNSDREGEISTPGNATTVFIRSG